MAENKDVVGTIVTDHLFDEIMTHDPKRVKAARKAADANRKFGPGNWTNGLRGPVDLRKPK